MASTVIQFAKYDRGSLRGVQIHNQREKEGVSNTNPDINWSRTHLNYDIHNDGPISYYGRAKERIAELELKRGVRKDAVLVCSFIISSSREFFDGLTEDQTREFFRQSYDFLRNRYGPENVVSAVVHLDERTPHMHMGVVPVTKDGRLSAKSIFVRTELAALHTAFHQEVGRHWGLERGREGSEAEHVEAVRWKAQQAAQEAERAAREAREAQEAREEADYQKRLLEAAAAAIEEENRGGLTVGMLAATMKFRVEDLEREISRRERDIRKYLGTDEYERMNEAIEQQRGQRSRQRGMER